MTTSPVKELPVDILYLQLKYALGREPTAAEFFSYLLERAKTNAS